MSKTAPEITSDAVKKAKEHECVESAGNNKEWMYVKYKSNTSVNDILQVESKFNNRLVPSKRDDLSEIGLDGPENSQVYYLEPHET